MGQVDQDVFFGGGSRLRVPFWISSTTFARTAASFVFMTCAMRVAGMSMRVISSSADSQSFACFLGGAR